MTTWAAIVRVSHMGDRKKGDASFHADAQQVADIERYAAMHGARVEFMPPELDVSGGLPIKSRPSLLAAIEGCERGEYDGIVVAYLSRLTRSRSGIDIWDRVEAVGGHVHCALENLDTSTPSGRFIRDIHLANAVREREERGEGFDRQRKGATDAGIWQRRQTPRGYARDEDTRRLVPSAQAPEVVQAFRDRAGGESWTAIGRRIGMTPTGAQKMIANRVYLGEMRVGQYLNPTAHPPLVDVALFEAAQRKAARPARSRQSEGPATLAGLVRCAGCGHAMTRSQGTYRCHERHSGEHCPAPSSIMAAMLDGYVMPIARREMRRIDVEAGAGDDVERATAELAEAEQERAAYHEVVSATDPAFVVGDKVRRERVERAKEGLRIALALRPSGARSGTLADEFDTCSPEGRNAILRGLLECVVVRRAGGRGKRMPLEDRVRVLSHGAPIVLPVKRAEIAMGVCPIPFPNADDPGVLRPFATEDELSDASSRRKVRAQAARG